MCGGWQADDTGRPVFAFSSLSSHTPDLRSDSRASLTVTARGYQARSAISSHATRTSWA